MLLQQIDLVMRNNSRSLSAGRQLLLKAVNRVWTELMHSKRQMLEDIFKVSLPCNDRGHVDIATARPALEEPALKSWQNHLGEPDTGKRTDCRTFTQPCPSWFCGVPYSLGGNVCGLHGHYITRSAIWEDLLLLCK